MAFCQQPSKTNFCDQIAFQAQYFQTDQDWHGSILCPLWPFLQETLTKMSHSPGIVNQESRFIREAYF